MLLVNENRCQVLWPFVSNTHQSCGLSVLWLRTFWGPEERDEACEMLCPTRDLCPGLCRICTYRKCYRFNLIHVKDYLTSSQHNKIIELKIWCVLWLTGISRSVFKAKRNSCGIILISSALALNVKQQTATVKSVYVFAFPLQAT